MTRKPIKPASRYRYGERTNYARAEHARQSREWRRNIADAVFSPGSRKLFLQRLWRRGHLPDAAASVGATVGQVYGRMKRDPAFAAAVERVLAHLCRGNPRCGMWDGYKRGGRCRECRIAKRSGPTQELPTISRDANT